MHGKQQEYAIEMQSDYRYTESVPVPFLEVYIRSRSLLLKIFHPL